MSIVIATPYDFTPRGKRRARVVPTTRGGMQLRWYVSGRSFRAMAATAANLALAREWAANEGAADNRPQPWESFR
jgi:hypothetical protein